MSRIYFTDRDLGKRFPDILVAAGLTVEINTAGFDWPAAEQYPSRKILMMLHARGVPVCFGSDSHRPEHVARHFDRARELARSVGWRKAQQFSRRSRCARPLA